MEDKNQKTESPKRLLNGKILKCETCGKEFYVGLPTIKYGNPRFCSRACIRRQKPTLPDGRTLDDLRKAGIKVR
jgi:hypothetical protein